MIYYIDTIEQTKGTEEGSINEYGKREQWKLPIAQVEAKFYKKLSDVSADLISIDDSKKHYYMNIQITDTTGGTLKEDSVGVKQETGV